LGLRVGCSGWNYSHWRHGVFYPEGLPQRSWLPFYAQRFDTVEVNSTFYGLPSTATVRRWAGEVPDEFVFAVKASRYLTHVRRLRGIESGLDRLLDRLAPLADDGKLGPMLWQLPPTLERNDRLLDDALGLLPRAVEHAFEFRHESWFCEPVYESLREHGVALVVADRAGSPGLSHAELTADLVYVRFHAAPGDGSYTHRSLGRWRSRLHTWAQTRAVYAYFNNDWRGFAPENAAFLARGRPD
jgi:uncharacterized protein YecE (DUF72 family)